MTADAIGKKILILSDNDGLSRAIALNLNKRLNVEIVRFALEPQEQWKSRTGNDHFDLIVLGMSSPASEPIAALARALLAQQVGRVPLLIISDRALASNLEGPIIHLDFPFDIDKLRGKVQEILQM
jgi:DNA-binding NarL/FixJ family response regulator